jgi:hypothetical protein
MLPGIVFFKTKFYPVEAVRFQDDGASVPFTDEVMMDGRGEDKITVGDKEEFGRIVGIVGNIRVAEHVGLFAGFDEQAGGVPVKMERCIFPEQRAGEGGWVGGIGGLGICPGNGEGAQGETKAKGGEGAGSGSRGDGTGSHDGDFMGI